MKRVVSAEFPILLVHKNGAVYWPGSAGCAPSGDWKANGIGNIEQSLAVTLPMTGCPSQEEQCVCLP